MNYIEYVNKTHQKKLLLNKIQGYQLSWENTISIIRLNESRYAKFKGVFYEIMQQLKSYQSGEVKLETAEIKSFQEQLKITNEKLLNLEPLLNKSIPNASTINDGEIYRAIYLTGNWESIIDYVQKSMTIYRIDETVNKIRQIQSTSNHLAPVKAELESNQTLISQFLEIYSELKKNYIQCEQVEKAKELGKKVKESVNALKKIKKLEKLFTKYESMASEQDAGSISKLINKIYTKMSFIQIQEYTNELETLINSIPVKVKNRKIFITKIVIGIICSVIFIELMMLYVVPFFNDINIWLTPFVLAILILLYKKKIIFK